MSEALPAPDDLVQHAAFVRRLARSLLADPHAADDVVQETWRASLERAPRGDPRGWLARVVRNFVHRKRRGDAHRADRERSVARDEALPPAEASLERTETLQRVVDAVRALEEPYRATILARYYEDLAPQAIAAREGIPVATVHSRLKRGLARLREELERKERAWRPSLGLIAGESPCLPPHAGEPVVWSFSKPVVLWTAAVLTVAVLWDAFPSGEPRSAKVSEAALAAITHQNGAAAPSVASTATPSSRTNAAPLAERRLSGRVVDSEGLPVAGASVLVLGPHDPFNADEPRFRVNDLHGRAFATDDEGRWSAELPEALRVLVMLNRSESYDALDPERWVEAPAENLDFRVQRIETATLVIRAFEGSAHQPIDTFRVAVHGTLTTLEDGSTSYDGGCYTFPGEQGVARLEIGLRAGIERRMHVVLTEPRAGGLWALVGFPTDAQPEQEVLLRPGTQEVTFVLPERGILRGQVVDESGAPIPDALVFFGEESRARGDEPFKPLCEERIKDGARTSADGWFELRGDGERVSVVHASYSPSTVDVARAGRIELGPRGALRGRVLDARGQPAVGLALALDQRSGPTTTTDGEGRFAFEGVEAGAHALWAGGRVDGDVPLACVRLAAGEERALELELGEPHPFALELAGAPPKSAPTSGILIGRDALFDVRFLEGGQSGASLTSNLVTSARPRPGTYWLVTREGFVAPLALDEGVERTVVELGRAELVVSCSTRTSVQLVPADADPCLRLFAARQRTTVAPDAPARFRAAPGAYALVGEAGAVLRTLVLPAEGLALTLD
jgi:RNA polymerase sigma-70 factor (ECF subfamily)